MNQDLPSIPFQKGWYSFDLPGYRPCRGTYDLYPYDHIPPLPQEQFTGQLQWLLPLESDINGEMQEEQTPRWADNLKSIVASARHLGLTLPDAFLRFLSSPSLQYSIPSCTACYFHLSQLAFCPGNKEKGYVLRFLHDQQDCLIWHLYLTPEGDECVLVSYTYLDQVYTNPEEFGQMTEKEALEQTWVCAPSFEAFLYRFWMENVLWFNLNEQKQLTEEQKRYLAFYGEEPKE